MLPGLKSLKFNLLWLKSSIYSKNTRRVHWGPSRMIKKYQRFIFCSVLAYGILFFAHLTFPQSNIHAASSTAVKKLTLDYAVMCEEIKDFTPENRAVVFSMKIGQVSCFTSFDSVPEKTVIFHKWFHKDRPSTEKKLTLKPPRWATYSSIQLREADKGPWRVEISDQKGRLFKVLRFSITD